MPFVRISMIKGRSDGQKKELISRVTDVIAEVLGVAKEHTQVLIEEADKKNWGVGGIVLDKIIKKTE